MVRSLHQETSVKYKLKVQGSYPCRQLKGEINIQTIVIHEHSVRPIVLFTVVSVEKKE